MKSTTGSILHAKVPAIIAATLCGILPAVKGAKDLQVPRACYGSQDVHLAIAWTGDQLKLCRDLGPRVVHGFRSVDPIGEDGLRCAPHRAIGALVKYDDGGERCEKAIVWGEPKDYAVGRTSFYLLKRGHAIAENLNRANDDRFVVWSNEKDHYPVTLGCSRYSFQVPPGHHLPELAPIAESVKILHVKTSLVRMAIALKYLPGASGIQISVVPPSEEVRASVSYGSGNPYAAIAAEAPFLVLGFKSCEPIGGKAINGGKINIRGARISWETSDGQCSSFDLAWYGPGSAPGNIPRGWVMAKRCNGNWLEIAANDRYRADPKLRYQRISQAQIDELIAHTRKCAASYAAEEAEYKLARPQAVEEQNDLGEDYQHNNPAKHAISSVEVTEEPQLTPAQRREIARILLANVESNFMKPGWVADDEHKLNFLAPGVRDPIKQVRESLGLQLMPDHVAANVEIARLLDEAAKLRVAIRTSSDALSPLLARLEDLTRWLADPSGKYPAQPVAFAS